MQQRLQNPVNASLGKSGPLKDRLERERRSLSLQQLHHVERL
jgi:hypothetical protein